MAPKSKKELTAEELEKAEEARQAIELARSANYMDQEIVLGCGMTNGEAIRCLPKPDIKAFMDALEEGGLERAIEANRPAVVGHLILRFFQGDASVTSVVAKLMTDKYLTKVRALALSSPTGRPGQNALAVEGSGSQVGDVLDRLLRSGAKLPDSSVIGLEILQEVANGG